MFMAWSGRHAGSTLTGKEASAASFSCQIRLSAGSSVVQTSLTLLFSISLRARISGSFSFSQVRSQTACAVSGLNTPFQPKKRCNSRWLQ